MRILWHREARSEAHEAAQFYAERQPGLDRRFLDILEDALNRIRRRPQMYPKVEGDIHKCNLRQLKFSRSCTCDESQVTGNLDQAKTVPLKRRGHVAANLGIEKDDFELAPV